MARRRFRIRPEAARIGGLIRERREALGITQAEAANRCEMSPGAIANYECGLRAPGITAVPKLSRGLGIPADQLIAASTATQRLAMLAELFERLSADAQVTLLRCAITLAGQEPGTETRKAPVFS